MNNFELVEFAKTKLGVPYVYGMKGAIMTLDKYNQLKMLYKDLVWDSDRSKVGQVCCDCSGLISWATGVVRSSSGYKEAAKEIHPISSIDNAPVGALVWQQGHIGIYIGNGRYIAEDGSAYGCRENDLRKSQFTHWFLCIDVEYVQTQVEQEQRYNTISELPDWAKPVILKLVDEKKIADENKLDLSYDMIRLLVIMAR